MGLLVWIIIVSALATTCALAQFNAPIGGSVYLFGGSPVVPDHQIEWNGNGALIARRLPYQNSTYSGRCTNKKCELFPNGTLRIDQLLNSDNLTFSVTLQLGSQKIIEDIKLNVYSLLLTPTLLLSSSIRPVNGTTLNLRCNAGSQTVHQIYFYRNEQIMLCNAAHLTCNASSAYLYFNPIMDIDSGSYSCVIQNPVSANSSALVSLNVAVRVSEVTLRNNATRPVTVERDSVALTCSSYGTEVSYYWTLMGSPLPENSRYLLTNNNSTLVIRPVSRSDQGSFICTVRNYLNSESSNALNLTWSPDGNIGCGAQRLGQSVQFSCLWPGGYPPALVQMLYHNLNLIGVDEVITEVPSNQISYGTQMSCNGKHEEITDEICSLVIDIPQSAGFINDSPKSGTVGSNVFLSVTLNSGRSGRNLQSALTQIFPAKFSWFRLDPNPSELLTGGNVSIISNDYSSFLALNYMTVELAGRYMCKAENPMGSNEFTFILNVTAEAVPDDSLSAGAIAGIVIGSVAVVALIAFTIALVFYIKDGRKQKSNKRDNNFSPKNQETPAPANIPNPYINMQERPEMTPRTTSAQNNTQSDPLESIYEATD